MSNDRTFSEKAKDLVETVKDKLTGHKDRNECSVNECNERAEKMYGPHEGEICRESGCRETGCNRKAEELYGGRIGRVVEETGYQGGQGRGVGLASEFQEPDVLGDGPPPLQAGIYGDGQL